MFKTIIKPILKYQNFSTSTIPLFNVNEKFKHNLNLVDKINIEIFNPNTVSKNSIFRNYVFNAEIKFQKNNTTIYQKFCSNNFENLIDQMNVFINQEIKL